MKRFVSIIAIRPQEYIETYELEHLEIEDGDEILFKTYNSTSGRCISKIFFKDFVYLSPEAADYLVCKKVSLVGIDYNSINKYADKDNLTHHKLLSNGILILETINLKTVPPGRYTLICAPLKIKDAGGSPTRAMLIS
jgi:arylformamidase